jgi:hypothetical protein
MKTLTNSRGDLGVLGGQRVGQCSYLAFSLSRPSQVAPAVFKMPRSRRSTWCSRWFSTATAGSTGHDSGGGDKAMRPILPRRSTARDCAMNPLNAHLTLFDTPERLRVT